MKKMELSTFHKHVMISESELQNIHKYMKKHKLDWDQVSFLFHFGSIGVTVELIESKTGNKKNVTDYNLW